MGVESLPMVVAEAPNARIASNAFFFTGGLESDAGTEVSVNWDSSSSSAAEMSGPKLFPLDCDETLPASEGFAADAAGVSMGGSEETSRHRSTAGHPFAGAFPSFSKERVSSVDRNQWNLGLPV